MKLDEALCWADSGDAETDYDGECQSKLAAAYRSLEEENARIHQALTKLCEARHSKDMFSPDALCDAIDAALMKIWGNNVGSEAVVAFRPSKP